MQKMTWGQAVERYGRKGYASNSLREELVQRAESASAFPVVNLAYTDYGGDFFDIVVMDYFLERHPENIVAEPTSYSGRNAFLFGEVAGRFAEETEKYLLGFDDLEEYCAERELDEYDKAFDAFIKDELDGKYEFERKAVLEHLREMYEMNCVITTQGVDYSTREWFEELTREGLILGRIEEFA